VSLALFRVLAGEFSAVADGTVENFLAYAALRIDTGIWGNVYDQALVYLAAHMLKMDPSYGGAYTGAAGAVIAQKDGDLSRSYAAPPAVSSLTDSYLLRTSYGAQFLALRDSRAEVGPMCLQIGVT
jgi:hypothetical protein